MLPGLFKDFAYERLGVPSFVLELGLFYNYLGLETADLAMPYEEYEREWKCRAMAWHDDNPEYGLFHDWKWVEHSQLDAVDIGGWDRVLFSNSPKGRCRESPTGSGSSSNSSRRGHRTQSSPTPRSSGFATRFTGCG